MKNIKLSTLALIGTGVEDNIEVFIDEKTLTKIHSKLKQSFNKLKENDKVKDALLLQNSIEKINNEIINAEKIIEKSTSVDDSKRKIYNCDSSIKKRKRQRGKDINLRHSTRHKIDIEKDRTYLLELIKLNSPIALQELFDIYYPDMIKDMHLYKQMYADLIVLHNNNKVIKNRNIVNFIKK